MEKYTMFMDRENQYSENEYTTQSNLQIQCNPYQATNGIFHRARINNFTICMEIQKKTQIAKAILRKKIGTGGINLPDFRLYYKLKIALEIELPYDPAIPLLGVHTKETRIKRDTCTRMFITALFTIARMWK